MPPDLVGVHQGEVAALINALVQGGQIGRLVEVWATERRVAEGTGVGDSPVVIEVEADCRGAME